MVAQFKPWEKWRVTALTGSEDRQKHTFYPTGANHPGSRSGHRPNLQGAESFIDDFRFFRREEEDQVFLFPPWETLPYDEIPPHPEILKERVACLHALLTSEGP